MPLTSRREVLARGRRRGSVDVRVGARQKWRLSPYSPLTHPSFAAHDPGPFNVERPARMRAIDQALSDPAFRD